MYGGSLDGMLWMDGGRATRWRVMGGGGGGFMEPRAGFMSYGTHAMH